MASESRGPSVSTRLAKAETLLAMALLTDLLVDAYIFPRSEIPPALKTLFKMTLIVGLYGPVMAIVSGMIDSGLNATRKVAANSLSVPRIGFHFVMLALLFTVFHYHMHKELPWSAQHRSAMDVRSQP